MPINVAADAGDAVEPAVRTAAAGATDGGRHLHGQPHEQHLARLRGEPGDLHPWQLSGRAVPGSPPPGPCSNTSAANLQARALLTLLNPAEGAYYLVNGVAQTYDQGTGSYHGVRFGAAEAHEQRLVG